jgi:hypothetical protein
MTNWTVGMKVMFGRQNGEKTLGEIVKVNPKKLKVKQLESRGVYKNHPIGSVWGVPRSLCTPVDEMLVGEKGVGKTFTPRTPRGHTQDDLAGKSEYELMDMIDGIDCQLSPENLTCDGMLSTHQVRRKYRTLITKRRAVEKALGRKVGEWEAYEWLRTYRANNPE